MKRKTTEDFIEDAIKVYGNKYDYSLVKYIHTKSLIIVKCNDCGNVFDVLPYNHIINNTGCPNCYNKLKTENILSRLNTIHGDKYEYFDDIYTNNKTRDKIKVYCKYHDEIFYISISNHLKGSGCYKCGINLLTKNDFIIRSEKIHGEKYCYEQVEMMNMTKKVKIFCNVHKKIFLQKPQSHLSGQGCPYCAKVKKKTTEEFIEESKAIHGNKYGYDKSVYKNCRSPVTLFCNTHKKYFIVNAGEHLLSGIGCPDCNILKPLTFDEFVSRAIKIHGNNFEYTNDGYVNSYKPIKIFCVNHNGYFNRTPTAHLNSIGCPICCKTRHRTLNEFIEAAKKIHGDIYDYSEVIYKNCRTKVKIYCKTHNKIFEQTPTVHLNGHGCPICSSSKGEIKVKNYLDSVGIKYKPQYENPTCKYKKMLRFDFGILDEENNILGIIEYQGAQHYKPFDFSRNKHEEKGIEDFKNLQIKDNIKREWCKNNNVPLLELRFDENKNLENNLQIFLNLIKWDK